MIQGKKNNNDNKAVQNMTGCCPKTEIIKIPRIHYDDVKNLK